MSLLSDAELAQIRADVSLLLPDICDILSPAGTADGCGGNTDAWGTASAGVACRLDPIRGNEQVAGAAPQAFYQYMLTLPHGTAITTENKVVISTVEYKVVNADAGKSWDASRRCVVERL
jgi:hypothetical protein